VTHRVSVSCSHEALVVYIGDPMDHGDILRAFGAKFLPTFLMYGILNAGSRV